MTRAFALRLLLVLALLGCGAGCKRRASAAPPSPSSPPPGGLALESASLPLVIMAATGPVDPQKTQAAVAAFAAEGRSADVHAMSKEDKAKLLDAMRDVGAPDASVKRVEDAQGVAFLSLRWRAADARALAAAYGIAASIADWPDTSIVAADLDELKDGAAWNKLAADAADAHILAQRHFVDRLRPEDDGSLTIETAGTGRFGLRTLTVDHLTRSSARSLAQLVNLLVQRWAEGQRQTADGSIDLVLEEQPADAGVATAKAARGHVVVKPTFTGQGTDAVARLEFPAAPGDTQEEKRQSALDQLFGSSDSSQNVEHSAQLLGVSRKSRERLIREQKPRVQRGLPAGETLLVKAPFQCSKGTEWMWVDVHTWKGSTLTGSLQSDPDCATQLHAGQSVEVNEGDLFDYMDKLLDGTFVGNDTGKLMQPDAFEELDGGRRRSRD